MSLTTIKEAICLDVISPVQMLHLVQRKKGYFLDFHCHNFFQFLYIFDGDLCIENFQSSYSLGAMQICAIRPQISHSLYSPTGYQQLGIDIDFIINEKNYELSNLINESFTEDITIVSLPDFALDFERKYQQMQELTTLNNLLLHNQAEHILLKTVQVVESTAKHPFVQDFLTMMSEENAFLYSLDEMCEKMHLSKTHLERMVRRNFDCGAIEYANKLRLSRACSLLISTHLTIGSIGHSLGFYDDSHFHRFFRSHMNKTPLQYRREFGYTT